MAPTIIIKPECTQITRHCQKTGEELVEEMVPTKITVVIDTDDDIHVVDIVELVELYQANITGGRA